MKWKKWLENWDMTSLRIKAPFLDMEWEPKEPDRDAAWELYVELLTRISTQPLTPGHGEEGAALESIHKLFRLTRETIKRHGRDAIEFTKVAVVVLNQLVRPFTTKWHSLAVGGALEDAEKRQEFRDDLAGLQPKLLRYTRMLADMAGVEDLTEFEDADRSG